MNGGAALEQSHKVRNFESISARARRRDSKKRFYK